MKDALNVRVFLLLILAFIGMVLFDQWQEEHVVEEPAAQTQAQGTRGSSIPTTDVPSDERVMSSSDSPLPETKSPANLIDVETDVLKIKLDPHGGDIVYAELKAYPKSKETPDEGFVLLDRSQERYYIAQTGLSAPKGPDSHEAGRAVYQVKKNNYALFSGDQSLEVPLSWTSPEGVVFEKIYRFEPNSYVVDIIYRINNTMDEAFSGKFYGQVQRRPVEKSSGLTGMQTYQGAALYTPEKKFKKISYSDMDAKTYKETIQGGWAAFVEHYFLTAWVPNQDTKHTYFTSVSPSNKYNVGSISSVQVPAKSQKTVQGQLYLGPELASKLETVAPGLELTVDYGILWPISQVIFWTMKKINHFVGNWGVSIILITILIKALFFKLSAASYRSMGQLRRVQPKIQALKERFGDDKQKFSQAMMEFYKKEKINPLGGCLPILVQIPVFIALYYVLLESVELRQAPFMLWIQDLSAKDPFYILPLLMGGSMLLQQKLSPTPPDPMQAKMMMIMPVVFTVLFLNFPAGLVLYWVVNNVLSILQQWLIMRKIEKEGHSKKLRPSTKEA